MVYEIDQDMFGNPYLKKVNRKKASNEPRGMWVEIGKVDSYGIEDIVRKNVQMGLIVLPDEEGAYRALVLTE